MERQAHTAKVGFEPVSLRTEDKVPSQINEKIEAEKKKSDELDNERKEAQEQLWMASSIEDMSSTQLDQYQLALYNLKKSLNNSAPADNPYPHFFAGDFSSNNESSPADNPHPQYFVGRSSSSNNPPL
ncbi:hypothetical protein RIF29_08789 [Crotalaria pallida]|uniref:Uncharacterized protein n=1 Tax=Crotalaria pallida TaxID=3830 RepID=A0AAN9FRA4_CROPI